MKIYPGILTKISICLSETLSVSTKKTQDFSCQITSEVIHTDTESTKRTIV